jgi:hypothetical protein
MSVGTVKVRQKTSLLITESLEVNDKHTSIRFKNPADLSYTLSPCFLWQMVKHDSAEYHVELGVGKWKCFCHTTLEKDLNASLPGFPFRSCKHLHRCIKFCKTLAILLQFSEQLFIIAMSFNKI